MENGIEKLHFGYVQVWIYVDGISDDVTHRADMNIGNGYLTINQLHLNTPI